ncbi:MAG TPA: acetyl-CoA carboxylase carboxyltransferase subunit alpha [Candidatus Mediterraneibacter caccavium]|uniref:Multifunctional fusion protein n=1 Tax=Candidatus Mediterraneibacter caccavium TaxID=2838661 RepID=A0A9D2AS09_9FIRM|nr:acetyl-CoA carboxylase carboxyltransferase subunit alpha [Lachnoclostridium sp. An76]OUN32937.1 acetyl-CoA carboxylase carboxyl transferase subunit beta [Lachnoclostridium sp. An76]HIX47770.1 acetyl-CoA carboxylase carboxyltransferase subunit alpha [Candidatus Mediterraneibacter caccavium]
MKLKDMFKKTSSRSHYISLTAGKPEVPAGLLRKCNKCGAAIIAEDVKNGYYICPKCHGYFRVHAYRRIEMLADEGSFEEWDKEMDFVNPLDFKGYEEKVARLKEHTNLNEAVVTGKIMINGNPAVIGVCDGRFMMASMGHIVGEKITRAVERATAEKLPVIIFTCSGGARMQEGIVSLMQMAKTSAALKRHSDAGQLYISVLTDPTTGGVTASFAMLGDIILAEPKALIGFAGPRVIEQTIGQKLPKGFQRSEFLLEHGFVDRIVEREEMKDVLAQILEIHSAKKTPDTEEASEEKSVEKAVRSDLTAWERVQISRKKDRPVGTDYIEKLFTDFMEFHGDRYFKDDHAIVGGIAYFHGMPVTVIAQAKGKTTKENLDRNFSMPSPDGYRKALRLMKQAEKFGRPVICFVDTPGAFCGLEAEERGQGEAIARNLFELSGLKVPVLSVVIGEGGSGGALAMAVADEVWMLENSIYSVLSPEGFASILWKDSKRASEAAEVMKLTAQDLERLGIVEQVISEPAEFTDENLDVVCRDMDGRIGEFLEKYCAMDAAELTEKRYERFRRM